MYWSVGTEMGNGIIYQYKYITKRSSITDNLNKKGDIEIRANGAFLEQSSSGTIKVKRFKTKII